MWEIELVTEEFEARAESRDYAVIYSAVDRGGAFEWRAMREAELKRYVSFAILPEWRHVRMQNDFKGVMIDVEGRVSVDSGHSKSSRVVLKYSATMDDNLFHKIPELIAHVFDQAEILSSKDLEVDPFPLALHAKD